MDQQEEDKLIKRLEEIEQLAANPSVLNDHTRIQKQKEMHQELMHNGNRYGEHLTKKAEDWLQDDRFKKALDQMKRIIKDPTV